MSASTPRSWRSSSSPRGRRGFSGARFVADRDGDVTTLTRDDVKLLTTFAGHAAALLENDRLEQSLAEVTMLKEQLQHQAYHDALTGLRTARSSASASLRRSRALAVAGQPFSSSISTTSRP